jgi:hypothetical protein
VRKQSAGFRARRSPPVIGNYRIFQCRSRFGG